MAEIGRINCYGSCLVPDKWTYKIMTGINRLYHIHSGKGGYRIGDKFYPFEKGKTYFFPYTTEYTLVSDDKDKIFHTYADFELIPPIISEKVLSADVTSDKIAAKALEIFISGGEMSTSQALNVKTPGKQSELLKLCFSSITYLVSHLVSVSSHVETVNDPIVISALEHMISHMASPLSVTGIAKESFLTTDSFIRRFKRCIGVTPYAYLKNLRIRTARYMLDEGKSLDEIACAVGYGDASSLLHAMNG